MAFKIVPRLIYDATKEYESMKKSYDNSYEQRQTTEGHLYEKGLKQEDTNNFQDKAVLMRNLQVLKIRMDQEQEFNHRLIKIRQGDAVLYGSEIQLQHLDSGSYLQISKQSADYDKQCTKVELTSNPSTNRVVFEIYPRYKYRQPGEKVIYEDQILIYNSKNHMYLHFSSDYELPQEETSDMPSTYRPRSPYRRLDPETVSQRFEVNVSAVYKKWQVLPYRSFIPLSDFSCICGGDVVRFKHAESGGYICVDDELSTKSGERKAYVRIYKGEDDLEQLSSNSLFEIEIDSEQNKIPGQIAQWNTEDNNEPTKFRLRHLNSGRVLRLLTQKVNNKDIHQLVLADSFMDNLSPVETKTEKDNAFGDKLLLDSFFHLESNGQDMENQLRQDSVVKVKCAQKGLYLNSAKRQLNTDESEEQQDNQQSESEYDENDDVHVDDEFLERNSLDDEISNVMKGNKEEGKIFTPINKDQFNNILIQKLFLKRRSREDDVFIVKKGHSKEIQDVLFIHSCVPLVKHFITQLRKQSIEKFTIPYFSQIEKVLENLIFFTTETENKDPFTCEGIPYKDRQKYLRELRVIDLLIDILYYPFQLGLYNIQELTQRHPITRICKLTYRLLKHIVKDNNANKFYTAQYIELFFNQAMITNEQNNFQAEKTITELLRNNKTLLDKQITKKTIQNFIDLCKLQRKNERFLNLLSTLCSCNEEAVASNQDDICEIMLQDEENMENLVIKMVTNDGYHEIVLKEPEIDQKTHWIRVEDLYEFSLKRDDLRIFNYFRALVNLSGEMCLQRNYKGILLLNKIYSQQSVLHCTLNGSIPLKLRSKFAKLLQHLHIDKDPLEVITVPVLTRVWQEILQSKTQLPKSKVMISPELLTLKPFVAKFFAQQNGITKAYEFEFNNYCIEILAIVQKMIKLGFYENENELIQMVDPLITLLDGSLDFIVQDQESLYKAQVQGTDAENVKNLVNSSEFKKKRYQVNEANLLLMSIKNKIITILDRVMDMQNDIRLTQFLINFYQDCPRDTPHQLSFVDKILKGKLKDDKIQKDQAFLATKARNDQLVIKWMNAAYEDKMLDLERISERDFVCIMLDLILYENPEMVNNAFRLLVKFFSQKKSIIDIASEVQLLESEEEIQVLRTVSSELTEMKKDAENAEFWFGFTNEPSLIKSRNMIDKCDMLSDFCVKKKQRVYDFANVNRLHQSMSNLERHRTGRYQNQESESYSPVPMLEMPESANTSGMVKELELSELIDEWSGEEVKVIHDEEENDPQNQRLLRNLRAHEVALILIRHQNLADVDSQNSYLRVLEKVYIFLIKFVRKNRENQMIMMPHIDLFIRDIEHGVHAAELIAEILKDNELLPDYNITPVIKRFIQIADEQPLESPKKATIISFLSYFLKSGTLILKENQVIALNELTSSSRKNSFHIFSGPENLKKFDHYLDIMRKHYSQFMTDQNLLPGNQQTILMLLEIFIPNELQYTIEMLRILAMCGEGKNSLTEIKCQSLFSIKDISDNLRMADFCYPYKQILLDYLIHIFLDVEKDSGDESTMQLWNIIEQFLEEFTKFIDIMNRFLKNKRSLGQERRTVTNKKSFEVSEIEKLMKVDVQKNFKLRNCFYSINIIDLFQTYIFENVLPCLTGFFELRLKMNEKQLVLVKKIIKQFGKLSGFARQKNHVKNVNILLKTLWKIPQLKELSEGIGNQAQNVQALNKEPSEPLDDLQVNKKVTHAMKLRAMMLSAYDSAELNEQFEKEFQQLILSIIFIKKKSEIGFEGKNTMESKDILKSLIKITDVNSSIEKDLRKMSLKIFRKIVELENKDLLTPAAEWDSEDWMKYEYQIQERQNLLTSLGIVKLLCRIISFENIRSIKEEAVLVAITVLLGGNNQSQQKFFKYFQKDVENNFAEKIAEMMSSCFEVIKKSEMKRNKLNIKHFQIEKKITELKEILESDGSEIRKLEQQLQLIDEEIKEFEQVALQSKDSETLTPSRAIKQLKNLFRFLQLLCENHNINLQNALRKQTNVDGSTNGKNYDLVSQLARIFGQYSKIFNATTCEIGHQIVDCLIEMIQGPCHGNQKALVAAKIIDSSRDYIAGFDKETDYLPLGFSSDLEDLEQISIFKKKIVTMLLSLLEGEADMDIITRMSLSLDFQVMRERMLVVFISFCQKILGSQFSTVSQLSINHLDSKLDKESFKGNISEAFEIFTLFHTLAENVDAAKKNLDKKKFTPDEWKAYDFIRSHTGKIEVSVNSNLQRVYFPIITVCHYVSKESRRKLMMNVNRESQSTKVNDLLNSCSDLIDEMIHNEELNHARIKITPQRLAALKDFSTMLAVIVNAILLIFVSRDNHYRDVDSPEAVISAVYYLGIIQGLSSGILIFFYTITRGGLITKRKWRELIKKNKGKIKPFSNEERLDVTEMSIEMTSTILLTKGPEAHEFNLTSNRIFGNAFTRFQYYMFNAWFFFQDDTFQYYLLYFMISMLGLFYIDIFYAFHLLDFIARFPVLQNVIKSVTLNKNQLLMTGLLQVAVIFVYSTVGFFYLQDTFIDLTVNKYDNDNIGENVCSTMFQCFVTCLNLGLRLGGGIGEVSQNITFDDTEKYFIKFIYDFTFQIFIIIVMLNILFGIIIDTFAYIRQFLIPLTHEQFDKYSDGFERHIERDHNLWQYVFYIVHLQMKDPTEYTGIESYVFEKVSIVLYGNLQYEQGDISWVPLMKAISLKGKIDALKEEEE